MAINKNWNIFHDDLKTDFFQGQFYELNRDTACELTSEADHHLYIVARLKTLSRCRNDVPRYWWNILDKTHSRYDIVPTRADPYCHVL